MTDLLDNALVKKYFGKGSCLGEPKIYQGDCKHRNCQALRMLMAMQEPIKPLEKYLYIERADCIYVANPSDDSDGISGFHPKQLRLPSRFQPPAVKKECESMMVKCEQCGYEASVHMPKQGDTTTFKIQPPPAPEKSSQPCMPWKCKNTSGVCFEEKCKPSHPEAVGKQECDIYDKACSCGRSHIIQPKRGGGKR